MIQFIKFFQREELSVPESLYIVTPEILLRDYTKAMNVCSELPDYESCFNYLRSRYMHHGICNYISRFYKKDIYDYNYRWIDRYCLFYEDRHLSIWCPTPQDVDTQFRLLITLEERINILKREIQSRNEGWRCLDI